MSQNLTAKNINSLKTELIKGARLVGKYDFPLLQKATSITKAAIPFDKASTIANKNQWVHFYVDDYRFERVWNDSNRYLSMLKQFQGVISPDFSFYMDMPKAMQIWNTYRNRSLGYWLQKNGIDVIPNVQWGDEKSYEFCFDGIPKGGTVAVSTNGGIQSKLNRYYFTKGLEKLVDEINPTSMIVYSNMPSDIFERYAAQGVQLVHIENYHATLRKKVILHG